MDLLVRGDLEQLKQAAEAMQARILEESTLTLDEIFLLRVGRQAAEQ